MELKPDHKKLVEALLSGNWTQGVGRLMKINSQERVARHCCLGVFCEVAGVICQILPENAQVPGGDLHGVFDGCSTDLPQSVKSRYGFRTRGGAFRDDKGGEWWINPNSLEAYISPTDSIATFPSLISMNDRGIPFRAIAAVIEKFPHLIFTGYEAPKE